MEFRLASIEDIDSIGEIFHQCWQISYKELLSQEVRDSMDLAAAKELWAGSLLNPDSKETYLGIDEGRIVSIFRLGRDVDLVSTGHLFSLYVHPMSAGKGFGSQTLEFVIQRLKSLGFQQISLWVFESNKVARNLYVGKGFQVTDLKRTDDRWKIPEIQMIKKGS